MGQFVGHTEHRRIEPFFSPIEIVPVLGMVAVNPRGFTEPFPVFLQCIQNKFPWTRFHRGAMETNLEPFCFQGLHVFCVFRIFHRLRSIKIFTAADTSLHPDGLGRPEPQFLEQIVYGLDVFHGRNVRIIDNRKGEFFPIWVLHVSIRVD
jgi:hypothetical protein